MVHLYPESIAQTQWKFPIAFKVLHSIYLVVRQIEHPPAWPAPRENGAGETASPPRDPRAAEPTLTAIVRPSHAQSVNLVRGGHGGQARVSAQEAARP